MKLDFPSQSLEIDAWHGTNSQNALGIQSNGFVNEKISTQGIFCAGVWTSDSLEGCNQSLNGVALQVRYNSRKSLLTYNDNYRGDGNFPIDGLPGFTQCQKAFVDDYLKRYESFGESCSLLFRKALLVNGYDAVVVYNNHSISGDAPITFYCLLDSERIEIVQAVKANSRQGVTL